MIRHKGNGLASPNVPGKAYPPVSPIPFDSTGQATAEVAVWHRKGQSGDAPARLLVLYILGSMMAVSRGSIIPVWKVSVPERKGSVMFRSMLLTIVIGVVAAGGSCLENVPAYAQGPLAGMVRE